MTNICNNIKIHINIATKIKDNVFLMLSLIFLYSDDLYDIGLCGVLAIAMSFICFSFFIYYAFSVYWFFLRIFKEVKPSLCISISI